MSARAKRSALLIKPFPCNHSISDVSAGLSNTRQRDSLKIKTKVIIPAVPIKTLDVWFDWVENDCIYMICFYIFWILIPQLKIWHKAIQNRLKVRRAMASESLNFSTRWWHPTRLFRKMHWFKAAILLYQSSLERINFVNLKETHLFLFVIK